MMGNPEQYQHTKNRHVNIHTHTQRADKIKSAATDFRTQREINQRRMQKNDTAAHPTVFRVIRRPR